MVPSDRALDQDGPGAAAPVSDAACSLTVLIPTYNRPALLARAVASALDDLPQGAEVLVVDDMSDLPARESLAALAMAESRLRILRNTGPRGAASARNHGVAQARGAVILFLDDDDELLPGYAARVARIAGAQNADHGFSAVLRRDAAGREERIGRDFASGPIPGRAALRHKIAALSAGFWIRRARFLAAGGLDPAQKVDEDTSLCCGLVATGFLPWYEAEPGVRVHIQHTAVERPGAQLTQAAPPEVVLDCYLRTWTCHQSSFPAWSEARWFLGARYLRRAAKLGDAARIRHFVATVRPRALAPVFAIYGAIKRLSSGRRRSG